MTGIIAVVGSANLDRLTRVAQLPAGGETVIGDDPMLTPGGKGGNQAVAAARLDGVVSLVGVIGADHDGRLLETGWANAGVDATWVVRATSTATGSATVLVADDSENMIVVSPGANALLEATHVADAVNSLRPDFVGLSLEIPVGAAIAAAEAARAVGARVFSNLSPANPSDRAVARLSDVVVLNQHEASELLGVQLSRKGISESLAQELLARVALLECPTVVITRGAQSTVIVDSETRSINCVPVAPIEAVDTTGCGDAFMGGLLVAAAEGRDKLDACRFANSVAAIAATSFGAQPSYPARSTIENMLGKPR